jgi:hypothetical protein
MRVRAWAFLGIAAALVAVPALSQPSTIPPVGLAAAMTSDEHLIMVPGRRASVAVIDDRHLTLKTEAEQTEPFEGGPAPRRDTEAWFKPDQLKISVEPGQLAFTLWSKDNETLLKLENGLGQPVVYVAVLILNQHGQRVRIPTNICSAEAGGGSVEMWPYAVEGIEIAQVLRLPPNAAVCLDPETQSLYRPGQPPKNLQAPRPTPAPQPARPPAAAPKNIASLSQVGSAFGA